jgi:hypothetical protein
MQPPYLQLPACLKLHCQHIQQLLFIMTMSPETLRFTARTVSENCELRSLLMLMRMLLLLLMPQRVQS